MKRKIEAKAYPLKKIIERKTKREVKLSTEFKCFLIGLWFLNAETETTNPRWKVPWNSIPHYFYSQIPSGSQNYMVMPYIPKIHLSILVYAVSVFNSSWYYSN